MQKRETRHEKETVAVAVAVAVFFGGGARLHDAAGAFVDWWFAWCVMILILNSTCTRGTRQPTVFCFCSAVRGNPALSGQARQVLHQETGGARRGNGRGEGGGVGRVV